MRALGRQVKLTLLLKCIPRRHDSVVADGGVRGGTSHENLLCLHLLQAPQLLTPELHIPHIVPVCHHLT